MNSSRRDFLKLSVGALGAAVTASHGQDSPHAALPQRDGFSFLHSYESTGRYWRGIEKLGLVRPGTGIRLVHTPFGKGQEYRFNAVAAKNGHLHELLAEHKPYFIVDRVVGGAPYHEYDFDQDLIDYYKELLGPRFLGGQVHEVLSNTHNDWKRFSTVHPELLTKPIRAEDFQDYFDWSAVSRYLEYGTLADYVGKVMPANEDEYWEAAEQNAKRQGKRFGDCFSYAEGTNRGMLAWPFFYHLGAHSCLVEVGPWASYQTQFSIASARGAARALGKPWGVFYAPWGPKGCTSWFSPEKSSWRVDESVFSDKPWPIGPEFGPSSAFQHRTFLHSYLSGAHTLHEEWGAECNLVDLDSPKLSSYGKVTQAFLDFQDSHPDVGVPYTPIALQSSKGPKPNPEEWTSLQGAMFARSAFDNEQANLPNANKSETYCYPPMAVPEIFDILPGDAPDSLLRHYREVIPASATDAVDRFKEAVARLCPFQQASTMPMQVNHRPKDGAWILGLYNPWGAMRGEVENIGTLFDATRAQSDVIQVKSGIEKMRIIHAWPENTDAKQSNQTIEYTIAPGGALVLEVFLKA